ncbi:MAG: 1,4-alpha-glucan branching protein GlgB [Thermoplasmata archaeon]
MPRPQGLPSRDDLWWFGEGTHSRAWEFLGAHPLAESGGLVRVSVWAPNAAAVSAIGDWNGWSPTADRLSPIGSSGIWSGLIEAREGDRYKFRVVSRFGGYVADKADPFATAAECPPGTASRVCRSRYRWNDRAWIERRTGRDARREPLTIYEMHLGSWRRVPEEGDRPLTYRELARRLPSYLLDLGFTHVEFLPVMEHPFYGSWGYQTTGYFAPTARYGTPDDLRALIDALHAAGIGVLLDWVPSHFPRDGHALGFFDGTHLYEHADPRLGIHPDWNSFIFNYGRAEVRSFLTSSAHFWISEFHADGLRLDAVASMLYRDYSRRPGEWIPNPDGSRENWDAVRWLRDLNASLYARFPGVETFAEESTAWPKVSRPVYDGGLGFGFKWDMGWMHDTLSYLGRDPLYRKFHHSELTFRALYAGSENFVLPLSHDEVVHGKGSLLAKMPGDPWQRRANLRLLYGMWATIPGKKLLFMGQEWGQEREWDHDRSLDWHLVEVPDHAGIRRWVTELLGLVRRHPALHARDHDPEGFRWVVPDDAGQSVFAFLRMAPAPAPPLLAILNATPVPRIGYGLGVPAPGRWRRITNGDEERFGGSGMPIADETEAEAASSHGLPFRLRTDLPPLAMTLWEPVGWPVPP